MASRRRCQASNPVVSTEVVASTTEGLISKAVNYRGYAGDVALMCIDEPEEIIAQLNDLSDALAGAGRRVEQGDSELIGLQNALICMHDVLKAYEEHSFNVPARLKAIHKRLEQRCHELDPKGPHL
jgi:hypothetical protein